MAFIGKNKHRKTLRLFRNYKESLSYSLLAMSLFRLIISINYYLSNTAIFFNNYTIRVLIVTLPKGEKNDSIKKRFTFSCSSS